MSRADHEKILREKNPPLQDAWEKYKALLKIYEGAEPYEESAQDILGRLRDRRSKASKKAKVNFKG